MDLNIKYQIFISSTYSDLIDARKKVTEKILSMYHFPIGMEMFSAGNDDQWTVIKRTIDISDYYVLIIGHRYGSTTEEGISYTEKEYDYAREKGIPVLAFIKDREAPTKPTERESEPVQQERLEAFVKKAMSSKMCDFWKTEEELSSKVSIALMKEFFYNPRTGWIRADKVTTSSNLKPETNLESYINNYLEDKKREGLSNKTLNNYTNELKLFLEFSKEKTILEIDTQHIKNYLRYREDNFGINAKSSMETIRATLRVFFDWLFEEKAIERNPVNKVKAYRYAEVIVETLDYHEINQLRNATQTPRELALIEILLSTGCQLGEIEKLSLKNIDWIKKTIAIIGINHRNRVVPLTNESVESLKKYIDTREDGTNFLFVTERKPYRNIGHRAIQSEVDAIAKRTTISKSVSPKVFRHTFAKTMLEKGYQMNTVQSLLGNKEYISTSETYVKITNENINNILKLNE
jgi:site-specific recombinase XerD